MLLSSPTNKTARTNIAAAVLASLTLFACGSDESSPDGVGGAAGSPGTGNTTSVEKGGSPGNGGTSAVQVGGAATVGGTVGQSGSTSTPGGAGPATGGAVGAAGAGSFNCNQGVNDGATCVAAGNGYVCDRSNSTANPRICTCTGNPLEWDCVSAAGGAGGGAGRGNGGAAGRATGGAAGRGQGGAATGGRAQGGAAGRGQGGAAGRGQGGAAGARNRGGAAGQSTAVAGTGNLPDCQNRGIATGDTCQANSQDCINRDDEACSCDLATGVAGGSNRRVWTCQ